MHAEINAMIQTHAVLGPVAALAFCWQPSKPAWPAIVTLLFTR